MEPQQQKQPQAEAAVGAPTEAHAETPVEASTGSPVGQSQHANDATKRPWRRYFIGTSSDDRGRPAPLVISRDKDEVIIYQSPSSALIQALSPRGDHDRSQTEETPPAVPGTSKVRPFAEAPPTPSGGEDNGSVVHTAPVFFPQPEPARPHQERTSIGEDPLGVRTSKVQPSANPEREEQQANIPPPPPPPPSPPLPSPREPFSRSMESYDSASRRSSGSWYEIVTRAVMLVPIEDVVHLVLQLGASTSFGPLQVGDTVVLTELGPVTPLLTPIEERTEEEATRTARISEQGRVSYLQLEPEPESMSTSTTEYPPKKNHCHLLSKMKSVFCPHPRRLSSSYKYDKDTRDTCATRIVPKDDDDDEDAICGCFGHGKPYKPRFTERPRREKAASRRPTDTAAEPEATPEDKTNEIDTQFKQTLQELELRLYDALLLASEIVEQEEWRRAGALRQISVPCRDPLLKNDAPSEDDDDRLGNEHTSRAASSVYASTTDNERTAAPGEHIAPSRSNPLNRPGTDLPRRRLLPTIQSDKSGQLAPGVHSGVIQLVVVPPRASSLRESRKRSRLRSQQPEQKQKPQKTSNEVQGLDEKAAPKALRNSQDSRKSHSSGSGLTARTMPQMDGPADGPVDGPVDVPSVVSERPRELKHQHHSLEANGSEGALHQPRRPRRAHHTKSHWISLRGRSHVSLTGEQGVNLGHLHRPQMLARDWSPMRKRCVASVACTSTAMVGTVIGIYAGLVPKIQYYIADFNHWAILGNVVFYMGLAVPTFVCWPLGGMHGRKPYVITSLALAIPLLLPQALAVSKLRSPYVTTWRWALLGSRGFTGLVLGFASMNFLATLLDIFGASLMSGNPHQELVDEDDVRRHGGGLGVWLGIWTWCFMGSIGVGFLVGAIIIEHSDPSWGFYVSIIILACGLCLNMVCPETRRSAFRRSVAQVRSRTEVWNRVGRGEVMMHRVKTGPVWWFEEVHHGLLLSLEMIRQPGFVIVALYSAWIYAQFVLIIVLLGSLTSKHYLLRSPLVGWCIAAVAGGALIGIPFQKANICSRARHHGGDAIIVGTEERKITLTSHFFRRMVFTALLPLIGIAYTMSSSGHPTPLPLPVVFAAVFGFLSCLAISECNGLIMETYDCSDLEPGMAGRSLRTSKPVNYSSFPRVASAFAVTHSLGYIFAAGSTGIGGMAQRNLGQRVATGTMAAILVFLTILLLAALMRFKEVRIIPDTTASELENLADITQKQQEQRDPTSSRRRSTSKSQIPQGAVAAPPESEAAAEAVAAAWRPVLIGNPTGVVRWVNMLELGSMTRWTEIRRKNHLIDERVRHVNRAALRMARDVAHEKNEARIRRHRQRHRHGHPEDQGDAKLNPGVVATAGAGASAGTGVGGGEFAARSAGGYNGVCDGK